MTSLSIKPQALSSLGALNNVITFEKGQLIILDPVAAFNIMLESDANSQEHRIVQIALQMQNIRQQQQSEREISAGRLKVLELEETVRSDQERMQSLRTELSELRDTHTREEMERIKLALYKEAKAEGHAKIAGGVFLLFPVVTLGWGVQEIKEGIDIRDKKPIKLKQMEYKMEMYREFYPDATLTEAFEYVKEHPGEFANDEATGLISIKDYKEQHPTSTFEDLMRFRKSEINEFKSRMASMETDRYSPPDFDYD
jgi:hypothetical protein